MWTYRLSLLRQYSLGFGAEAGRKRIERSRKELPIGCRGSRPVSVEKVQGEEDIAGKRDDNQTLTEGEADMMVFEVWVARLCESPLEKDL